MNGEMLIAQKLDMFIANAQLPVKVNGLVLIFMLSPKKLSKLMTLTVIP